MSKSVVTASVLSLLAAIACGDEAEGSAAAIAAPSALKVEFQDGGAHVTWKDNSEDESEFMIERKRGSAGWSTLASVPFDTTQYHDADLAAGEEYTYRVMAMPKSGKHDDGAYSDEVEFTAPASLGDSDEIGAAGSGGDHSGHTPGGGS